LLLQLQLVLVVNPCTSLLLLQLLLLLFVEPLLQQLLHHVKSCS
jgi:hypothetical protein